VAALAVALPPLEPHPGVCDEIEMARAEAGWVMVMEAVFVHPLLSVTVKEYVPAVNALIVAVVAAFDHL
jgi:hypothetical protein